MWKKVLGTIILFYFFALLQSSFLPQFNFFGAVPNLVFIFFFLLAFFCRRPTGHPDYQVVFLAICAGFFLDIFSCAYIGPSIILLIITGFLLKSAQALLKNREDKHPFVYFAPLFVIFLLVYNLLTGLYLYFLDPNKIAITFGTVIVFSIIYNLLIASALFYFYKKWLRSIR